MVFLTSKMSEKSKMAESKGAKPKSDTVSKVFIFTPPRFEINTNTLPNQGQLKRKHFDWEVSCFALDLRKSKISHSAKHSSDRVENTEAFSELNLNYEFEEIRNSVIAYLEETFSENSGQGSQGFNTSAEGGSIDVNSSSETTLTKQSAQQEYAFSLEQSQKLFDRMQGFVEMSVDELHKFDTQTQSNQSTSQSEVTESLSNSLASHENLAAHISSFTKLSDCTKHLSTVNVFVVVLQVNPVKEIKIKSGINCGQFIKVSSVLVGDPTKEYFKLTFWRKAAEWVNTIKEGDMLVVKELKIEKWNEEFYGQTTFRTTLVNFQRNSTCKVPAQWLTIVNHGEVKSLLKWLKEKHSYLMVNKTASCEDVEWKTLKQFVPNTLVHYRAKIVKVLTYGNTRNKYEFEKRQVNKIVAVAIDQETWEEVPICLWGSQADWQYELKSKIGQSWCFKFLRVQCNTVHGQLCLHTTPRSTKKLENEETTLFGHAASSKSYEKQSSAFSNIFQLLEANLNGKATIVAGITKITCAETLNSEKNIDKTSDSGTVHQFFHELVYLGCKLCLRVLKQDKNGIYVHCAHCREHNSSYMYAVMYCFKPCLVYLSDKSVSIIVKSCHRATSKLLKDVRPQDVLEDDKSVLPERMQRIFNTANRNVKVVLNCDTVLDENGFVKTQSFELIDIEI